MDGLATWRGRPAEVAALALYAALGAALCLVSLVAPLPGRTVTLVEAALAATAAGLALTLWLGGGRIPRVAIHLAAVFVAGGATVLVARSVTGEGAVTTAVAFVWLAIYVAVFLPGPLARAHVALHVVGLAVGLRLSLPTTRGLLAFVVLASSAVLASEVLGRTYARLRRLTVTDPLTGALNRAGLQRAYERERVRAARRGSALSVVLIDLDGFKAVNDRHGHAAGDRLLVELVATWRDHLRADDVLARIGGDEFALVLPDAHLAHAELAVARLRRTTLAPFTAGVAVGDDPDLTTVLARADAAMYRAKPSPAAAS